MTRVGHLMTRVGHLMTRVGHLMTRVGHLTPDPTTNAPADDESVEGKNVATSCSQPPFPPT